MINLVTKPVVGAKSGYVILSGAEHTPERNPTGVPPRLRTELELVVNQLSTQSCPTAFPRQPSCIVILSTNFSPRLL
jgi:hypothetical protein